jgi:hypothetical protein
MNFSVAFHALARGLTVVQSLCRHADDAFVRWKPDEKTWSMLEVLGHLLDEEREDFRARIDFTLNRPGEPWPAIRPAEWVTERHYNAQDLSKQIGSWHQERVDSLEFLRAHEHADWMRAAQAPWGGELRAGDLLASWVVHDALHIRQINELYYTWQRRQLAPFDASYAGDW